PASACGPAPMRGSPLRVPKTPGATCRDCSPDRRRAGERCEERVAVRSAPDAEVREHSAKDSTRGRVREIAADDEALRTEEAADHWASLKQTAGDGPPARGRPGWRDREFAAGNGGRPARGVVQRLMLNDGLPRPNLTDEKPDEGPRIGVRF